MSIDPADINNRFDYHKPQTDRVVKAHETVRKELRVMADTIDSLVPDGREKSLAITKLEEAMMWANAGIARCWDYEKEMDR